MADTLTGLIPDIYEAMDIVSREKIGLAQSVTVEATGERVAKGQDVVTDIASCNRWPRHYCRCCSYCCKRPY